MRRCQWIVDKFHAKQTPHLAKVCVLSFLELEIVCFVCVCITSCSVLLLIQSYLHKFSRRTIYPLFIFDMRWLDSGVSQDEMAWVSQKLDGISNHIIPVSQRHGGFLVCVCVCVFTLSKMY